MSSVSKVTTITLDTSDPAIRLNFFLPAGATVPNGIMVQLGADVATGVALPPITIAQAIAGTGFTAAQVATFLRAVLGNVTGAAGYA